ncbi:D-arabino-3-hexulose 6-phosphate formaldehyde lyase [Salmonella enterica subsp. enterica]|uniref:D-arabino-3-hexulose 6-phosphate formaldehyde lyase n=1 Tax=Salmonella enterica I TaxID=59201 RepID=A0A3S4IHS0_SALET|nr:D-arabino-3-hexulose 6-phosphate formaldehyde lyase [Salmonella enterica subsp. enterica]
MVLGDAMIVNLAQSTGYRLTKGFCAARQPRIVIRHKETNMKLQLALDELTLPEAMVFMDKVVDDVDIIEVGTPFLIREGVNAIKAIKEKYPHKEVLADAKIMDGGHFESQLLFDAGAGLCPRC